jgi:hypothetical protein
MSSFGRAQWLSRLALAAGMLLAGTQVAWAQFFDPCVEDGDGTITVTEDTTVSNQSVTLQTDCEIVVAEGVTLSLLNVNISVPSEEFLEFEGGDTSILNIRNTRINACDSDIFGFQAVDIMSSVLVDPPNATCDVKELEPTGSIRVVNSVLTTNFTEGDTDIDITSELGDVTVRTSVISSGDDVLIQSEAGNVTVQQNNVSAVVTIEIIGFGAVQVTRNTLRAGDGVTVTGNPCTSSSNSPNVPCT